MGGSALGGKMARLSRERYSYVASDLQTKLLSFFEHVELPACLTSKESFGDVDFIVASPCRNFNALEHLGSKVSVRNGNIVSFEYKGHQVDLISTEASRLDLARFYFSYGDLGMIIGMMCRVLGLKSGFKGLFLMHEYRRIKLSENLKEILRFLDFSRKHYENGFTIESEIFDFVTASKYFRASMFARDGVATQDPSCTKAIWNRDTKDRLRSRDMFRRFTEHCRSLPTTGDKVQPALVRQEALTFFEKQWEFDEMLLEEANRAVVKKKYNGKIVNEITKLTGAELGRFMSAFRTRYPAEALLNMTPEMIRNQVHQSFTEQIFNKKS